MNRFFALSFIFLFSVLLVNAQTGSSTPSTSSSNGGSAATVSTPTPEAANRTKAEPVLLTSTGNSENSNSRYVRKNEPARIPHFEAAPVIDGQLNDAVWQGAAVFGEFLQTQPGDNVAPSNPTEVLIGYDSKNIYIAFRAKQDRDKIRATVGRRDNVFSDDFVGMYIDTFNDQRQAYFIFLNPLGIQGDGTFTEGNGEDSSVDLVFESR
ncbi:MAG TPA: carbohydrate binding family 9 domain-containing protein, partial [Pyrinomonadaceae bacterium]|nr:carbohydrate binding family 9 domain-containing protein [Pyrinomonadaceae bacterium]